jgi:hypothetical protein
MRNSDPFLIELHSMAWDCPHASRYIERRTMTIVDAREISCVSPSHPVPALGKGPPVVELVQLNELEALASN